MSLQILQRDFVLVPSTARAALVPAPALLGPGCAALAMGILRGAAR
jgi:hypothetical protein